MASGAKGDLPDDPRLMQAVQEFLAELEAGNRPEREAFLRRYPDLREALAQCLDGLELVHRAAGRESRPGRGPSGLSPDSGELPAGTPLGDFQILREIGRGGMGIVYEATQLSLGRRVALKVLPFAATFDPKHLQRFQNEAKAAAQLHHTNIVPVYAVGCERGVHFYAMQIIEGQSLAELIWQLRQSEGRTGDYGMTAGSDRSTQPQSLGNPAGPGSGVASKILAQMSTLLGGRRPEYFQMAVKAVRQAAEALDYAHQNGIVHRDIKPGNLLVDDQGRLWITDFGLAQFQAEGGITRTGDLLGTLRYMSPEQAAGRRAAVDHRSDLYSLGATLYELATLEPIFPSHFREELLQSVIHEEPRAPRSLENSIPEDLETIILKAISKDPQDRYGSAGEMAADLGRFLGCEPIRARRPSVVDQAQKWLRRNPWVAAAGLLFFLLCSGALLVNNRLIASEQAKTEERFRLARRSVDDIIRIADEELSENPSLEGPRKRLLETALAYYQEFIEQRQGDPKAQEELESTRNRVKHILADLVALQSSRRYTLLGNEAVLDDLGLSADQREQVAKLSRHMAQEREEAFREFHRLSSEERTRRFLEQAKSDEGSARQILSPEKVKRLQEIALQSDGVRAFRRSEVISALGLTPEQRSQIRAVEAEAFVGRTNPFSSSQALTETRKLAIERIKALFTESQMKEWEALIGEPFRGALPIYEDRHDSLGAPPGKSPPSQKPPDF